MQLRALLLIHGIMLALGLRRAGPRFGLALRGAATGGGAQTASRLRLRAEDDDATVELPTDLGALPGDGTVRAQNRDVFLFGAAEERRTFRQLGVREELCRALDACGKSVATSVQAKSFPVVSSGKDVVIAAETGSGKTYSYLIPLMQKCLEERHSRGEAPAADAAAPRGKYPSMIVMVPNKSLCIQVQQMAEDLVVALKETSQGETCIDVRAVTAFTGRWPFHHENGPEILICTPTFLSRFVKGGHALDEQLFRSVRHLVLDEADMLLDGSYLQDVEKVLLAFKLIRREMIGNGEIEVHETVLQHILSAATLPSYGLRSMDKYIESHYPRAIRVSNTHLHKHHPCIEQTYIHLADASLVSAERIDAIKSACVAGEATMIFVNTAEAALELADALRANDIECAQFHKLHPNRQEELEQFRQGKSMHMICTDAAARGLDLPNVRHVIQAEFALNVVQHMHRIGRASRAGVAGRATSLFDVRSEMMVDSIKTGIVSSFSRRRGLRKKWKKIEASGN